MAILTLESKWREYGSTYTFSFSSKRPVRFEAGQYAHIALPRVAAKFAKPTHEFSIASSPGDPDIRITTDTGSKSAYKQQMEALKPGDHVLLYKVKGEMKLPENAHGTYVMLAGGIGITPFRSILRDIDKQKTAVTPVLIHVGNPPYLYENELTDKPFEQYRIQRSGIDTTLQEVRASHPESHYFVAGSEAFVGAMAKKLEATGIPRDMIVTDEFEGLKDTV